MKTIKPTDKITLHNKTILMTTEQTIALLRITALVNTLRDNLELVDTFKGNLKPQTQTYLKTLNKYLDGIAGDKSLHDDLNLIYTAMHKHTDMTLQLVDGKIMLNDLIVKE